MRSDHDRIEDPELGAFADRLEHERPVPSPGFRAGLLDRLLADETASRPRRIWALVTAYGAAGVLLMAVAAVGLAGVGPFAA
jgi:hypothetical protein